MKELSGSVTVGFVHDCATGKVTVEIELVDKASGLLVAVASMDPAAFALALGARNQKCELRLNTSTHIGKTIEVKRVVLTLDRNNLVHAEGNAARKAEYASLVTNEHETDGWSVDDSDLWDHHRWRKSETAGCVEVELTATRYV